MTDVLEGVGEQLVSGGGASRSGIRNVLSRRTASTLPQVGTPTPGPNAVAAAAAAQETPPDVGGTQGNLRGGEIRGLDSKGHTRALPTSPWAQQPGETARAYAMFVKYRDAGPVERSIRKVAGQTGRSLDAMEQLSRRHSWVARAAAWDDETERLKRSTHVREIEALARREVVTGRLLQSRGVDRIRGLAEKDLAQLTIGEAVRLVVVGARMEQGGLGVLGMVLRDLAPPPEPPTASMGPQEAIIEILRRHPSSEPNDRLAEHGGHPADRLVSSRPGHLAPAGQVPGFTSNATVALRVEALSALTVAV